MRQKSIQLALEWEGESEAQTEPSQGTETKPSTPRPAALAHDLKQRGTVEIRRYSGDDPSRQERSARSTGLPQSFGTVQRACVFMNRRMRIRTYGGVGGRKGNNPAYPI
jgi:hypothetical protein